MDGQDQGLISRAIACGVLAGSYGYWARQCPEGARGLTKMRDKASREATALLDQVVSSNRHDVRKG